MKKSAWRKRNWDQWTFWKKVRHVLAVIGSLLTVIVMFLMTAYIVLVIFGLAGFIMKVRDFLLLELMHTIFGQKGHEMKKKARLKRKQCGSKMPYKSAYHARLAIKYSLKKHFIFHKLNPYKCKHCGKWHIGRTNIIDYDKFKELK